MSRLSGLLDPEARAYFEAIEAAVRPGRHEPDGKNDPERATIARPPNAATTLSNWAWKPRSPPARLGLHRGHPVTVVVTTTLAELEQAAHAAADASVPMPAPATTGGGSRLPMPDLIRMAAKAIHYLAVFDDHTERPLYLGRQKRIATADQRLICHARDRGCTRPNCLDPGITAKYTMHRTGPAAAAPTPTNYFSGAAATTPWQAAGNCTPWSPTAADSDGPTAPAHPRSTTPTTPTNSSAETPTRRKSRPH